MSHRMPGNRPEMPAVSANGAVARRFMSPTLVSQINGLRAVKAQVNPSRPCKLSAHAWPCAAAPSPPQVADETRAEFAKGLAEAMKRSVDKKADHLQWEQRLEAASAPGAAGTQVSRAH
jgi:hypothetical protein